MASDDLWRDEIHLLRQLAHVDGGPLAYSELTWQGPNPKARVNAAIASAIEKGYIEPPARRADAYSLTDHGWKWWRTLCSR